MKNIIKLIIYDFGFCWKVKDKNKKYIDIFTEALESDYNDNNKSSYRSDLSELGYGLILNDENEDCWLARELYLNSIIAVNVIHEFRGPSRS